MPVDWDISVVGLNQDEALGESGVLYLSIFKTYTGRQGESFAGNLSRGKFHNLPAI